MWYMLAKRDGKKKVLLGNVYWDWNYEKRNLVDH